jgi:hypothetical protein
VLYGSPDAMATDAVSRRSRAEEHVMKTNRRSLVEDSLALLREVRAGLHNESNRELVAALDEAMVMLEVIISQEPVRADHAEKVLKVLGQGLAALPVLQRLIELLKD